MKTETKLTQAVTFDRSAGKVLTIILNTDQAIAVNRNRDFEIPVNSKLRDIEAGIKDKNELAKFLLCAELGRQRIQSYQPRAKGLALFLQGGECTATRELNIPLETDVRWADLPHIQPLVEAGDEFEEFLIVVLDGREARLFTVFLGNIDEHLNIQNPFPTTHTQAPGNDRTKSQPAFHRKSDEREQHFLKSVVAATEEVSTSRGIRRIVLAGNNEAAREFHALLPESIRCRVIAIQAMAAQCTADEIARVAASLQYRAERNYESAKVASLLSQTGRRDKAVTGLFDTMEALADGRVHELVYAQGISPKGELCGNCGYIAIDQPSCPKCKSTLGTGQDAMDLIIGAALDTGAAIEQVRGAAAEKLMASGGIGAFLRY